LEAPIIVAGPKKIGSGCQPGPAQVLGGVKWSWRSAEAPSDRELAPSERTEVYAPPARFRLAFEARYCVPRQSQTT